MVKIEAESCIGCGACVRNCLSQSLALENKRAVVKKACIQCGHCVAVCPVKAVSIPEYDMQDIEEHEEGMPNITTDTLLHTIKFRRSIRNYKQTPIEIEKAEKLIQAGRYTATAVNCQGCRFIFVQEQLTKLKEMVWNTIEKALNMPEGQSPEGIEAYRGFYEAHKADAKKDYLFRNAPAVLYIAAERTVDAALAAQNIEHAALSQGLGVLYNGYLVRASMQQPVLNWLETNGKPLALCMLIGYPNVRFCRTAPRKKAEIVWK